MDQKKSKLYLLVFFLVFISNGYFFQSGHHNENARYAQVRSIVDDGRLPIGRYAGRTADTIKFEKQIFPNKAPGTVFMGVLPWSVGKLILSPFEIENEKLLHYLCHLVRWFSIGLVSALISVLLLFLATDITGSLRIGLFTTMAYTFGTIAFPYSTLYISHQLHAFLGLAAFSLIYCSGKVSSKNWLLCFGAGVLSGYAGATEYTAPLIVGPVALYLFIRLRSWGYLFWFICGMGVGFLPHIVYSYLAFGKLHYIPYQSYLGLEKGGFQEHKKGFLGVSLPALKVLKEILWRPQRGLLYFNPWLILSLPALFLPIIVKTKKVELSVCILIVLGFIAFNAGYGESIIYWGGGSSVGPRHIVPMLPFISILIAPLLKSRILRWLSLPLVIYSVGAMVMATAVEPRASHWYPNPLKELFWKNFLLGNFGLHYDGVFNSTLLTFNSVSFNWGKLLGISGELQLLPLFLLWVIAALGLRKIVGVEAKGFFLTVLLLISVLFMIPVGYTFVERVNRRTEPGLARYSEEGELLGIDSQIIGRYQNTQGRKLSWKGVIRVTEPGQYRLGVESRGPASLYIDGVKLISKTDRTGRLTRTQGGVNLSEEFHSIELEAIDPKEDLELRLIWSYPREGFVLIPPENLSLREVRR